MTDNTQPTKEEKTDENFDVGSKCMDCKECEASMIVEYHSDCHNKSNGNRMYRDFKRPLCSCCFDTYVALFKFDVSEHTSNKVTIKFSTFDS